MVAIYVPEWLVALEVQDPNKTLLTAKAKNRNTHYDMCTCTYINGNTVTICICMYRCTYHIIMIYYMHAYTHVYIA